MNEYELTKLIDSAEQSAINQLAVLGVKLQASREAAKKRNEEYARLHVRDRNTINSLEQEIAKLRPRAVQELVNQMAKSKS